MEVADFTVEFGEGPLGIGFVRDRTLRFCMVVCDVHEVGLCCAKFDGVDDSILQRDGLPSMSMIYNESQAARM